ncbi:MAG: RsmD family RNA methyltransferase, partial [Candidatus Saccharibacteria bacterium]|nr:RsmD family RNA methyltransferase [Candidatus Saccharibacteria bacterium]
MNKPSLKPNKIKSGGRLRITSGEKRGAFILTPGGKTHPMGERERLALFNMLGPVNRKTVLDLFAGSGALGIEALSRGAKSVIFVDSSPLAARSIKRNLEKLGYADRAIVKLGSVINFRAEQKFDLIFADPPYDDYNPEDLANIPELLKKGGLFVLSHPKTVDSPSP